MLRKVTPFEVRTTADCPEYPEGTPGRLIGFQAFRATVDFGRNGPEWTLRAYVTAPLELIIGLTGEVFCYDPVWEIMTSIDGQVYGHTAEAIACLEKVPLKQAIPSVEAWRADPGLYSHAHYVRYRVDGKYNTSYEAGGATFAHAISQQDNSYVTKVTVTALFADRNLARRGMKVQE